MHKPLRMLQCSWIITSTFIKYFYTTCKSELPCLFNSWFEIFHTTHSGSCLLVPFQADPNGIWKSSRKTMHMNTRHFFFLEVTVYLSSFVFHRFSFISCPIFLCHYYWCSVFGTYGYAQCFVSFQLSVFRKLLQNYSVPWSASHSPSYLLSVHHFYSHFFTSCTQILCRYYCFISSSL